MVIALLTDFGTSDYFVGAVKGTILSIDPAATIVDITHDIQAHDVRAASFILASCCEDFPLNTVFMAVVDPGVGSSRRAVAVAARERIFVAPDNGLLSDVLRGTDQVAVELTNKRYFGPRESSTFHGRDIFGPVSAYISLGVPVSELGPDAGALMTLEPAVWAVDGDTIAGEIIHIDRFGNLITNFTLSDIPSDFRLDICGIGVRKICKTYSEVPRGDLFLIEGSSGRVEVSLREASAADLTGAGVGQKIIIHSERTACRDAGA
jgi:S-adenosyl-L-methionine hydrolase (adenosine-forming)